MGHTHPLVKVNSVAHKSRVVDEIKARPGLWYVALEEQLLSQLYIHAWMKHLRVPQTVDKDDHVVVELPKCLAANVEGLLGKKKQKKTNQKKQQNEKNKTTKSGERTSQLNHSPALQSLTPGIC